jgi:threonine synthase
MEFYSTNNKALRVSLKEAVQSGLAKDGGLFMPVEIPRLPSPVLNALHTLSFKEIAFEMARLFTDKEVPEHILQSVIEDAFNFDAPLHRLQDDLFVLELFHGPTLAFKDFGARFMARLMAYFSRHEDKEITILAATSGDTGSAVASGFFKQPGIRVVLLYPSGMVSEIQEKQLTTIGGNVTALEVLGNFDDCQRLVKQAFTDPELRRNLTLSSANSINIARLLPQSFYYAYAVRQLSGKAGPIVVSVPSGNLGNLTAGVFAQKMGIPIQKFVSAMNVNDVYLHYLQEGRFNPREVTATLSNAMDVGNPSNFFRLAELFRGDWQAMRQVIHGQSFTDDDTRKAIQLIYEKFDYLMDPHGAVGYLALMKTVEEQRLRGWQKITLETAHPAKFKSVVEACIRKEIPPVQRLQNALEGKKQAVKMSGNFEMFKEFLLEFSD